MINSYKKALDAITASEDSKQRTVNEFVRLNSVKNKMVVKKESKPARKGLWKYLAAVSMVCLLVAGGIFGIVRGFGSSGITVLAAPLNIETETETKKLTWSEVENSIGYVLLFDNGEYIEVEDNYFLYEHFRGGVYSFRIMAKGNGILFSDSDWSASKTFTVVEMLKAPQNVVITDSYLTWDAVEFASGYIVQIDAETVSLLSSQTSYSLASLEAGYYDIKVKAVGNGHTFLDSGFTVALNYMAVQQLETPTNLRYNSEERVITWDEVANADKYSVSITLQRYEDIGFQSHSGSPFYVTTVSFSLDDQLQNWCVDEWWDYKVTVKAISDAPIYSASDKSSELAFTLGVPGMRFTRVNNDTAYELDRCAQSVNGEELEHVVIPAYYNGKPVIGIGSAFRKSGLGKHPVKSVIIPDTVTYIGRYAFEGVEMERIIIPQSVTKISYAAFSSSHLLEIVILNEQIVIEDFAFSQAGTPPLARVYFGGDETAWNALTISTIGNSGLFDAQRFYYSETPILDGSHWRFVDGLPAVWVL